MEKKRHHYVPKAYLKAFCNANGRLHVYLKDDLAKPIELGPDNAGFRKYYYSQPTPDGSQDNNRLEDHFSTVEAKWPAIVAKFRQTSDVNAELGDIFAFIALQRARVPAAREMYEALLAESVMTTARMLDAKGKLPSKPKGLEDLLDRVEISIDPHQSILAMVKMIEGTGELLGRLGIGCLHNRTTTPFLTSDNPVIWFDPTVREAEMQPYNIRPDGKIAFLFPAAPDLLIYGHSSMRENFARHGFGYGEIKDLEEIALHNRTICRFAYEAVFASSAGQEEVINECATLSPVLESRRIPVDTGFMMLHRTVFGRRTKRPKWRTMNRI